MANTKSAQKAHRQSEKRAARNKGIRSAVRTHIKKAATAVADAGTDASEVVRQAVSALDVAARKGVIHPNNAARRKSRLMKRLHALSVAPATEEAAPVEEPKKARTAARKTTTTRTRKAK